MGDTAPRPLLKWPGGKYDLGPVLIEQIGKVGGTYREPFVGAGGAYLRLWHAGCLGLSVLSDINADLVWLHYQTAKRPLTLSGDIVDAMPHNEAEYYALRHRWNGPDLERHERAAAMVALNKSGFNGLHRNNRAGKYNVAWGKNPNPYVPDIDQFFAVSRALSWAALHVEPWQDSIARAVAGDTVYLDPPYLPLKPGSDFTGYTAGGFGWREHEALAAACLAASQRGARVLLSNHDTPKIRALYARFGGVVVWSGAVQSRISRSASRPPRAELMIRWGAPPVPVRRDDDVG